MRPLKLHWFWTISTGKINRPAQPTLFIRRISGSSCRLASPSSSVAVPHRPPLSSPLSFLARAQPHLPPPPPFRNGRRPHLLHPFSRGLRWSSEMVPFFAQPCWCSSEIHPFSSGPADALPRCSLMLRPITLPLPGWSPSSRWIHDEFGHDSWC